jgi:hypothetical protein
MELSISQRFEIERFSRAIDATTDPQVLRGLAKQLLEAWHSQKAATQWVMRQQLGAPPQFSTRQVDPSAESPPPQRPLPADSPGDSGLPHRTIDIL